MTAMRVRLLPVLASLLALSACGARTDLLVGSDAGLPQPASTSTGTSSGTGVETDVGMGSALISGTTTDVSAASCILSASNYDQSCVADSDCAVVPLGNLCVANAFECDAAISVSANTQYSADLAQTPFGSNPEGLGFGCTAMACCRQSLCTTQCTAGASDTLSACAMTGGLCEYAPEGAPQCSSGPGFVIMGPAPLCAYADEVCCVLGPTPR